MTFWIRRTPPGSRVSNYGRCLLISARSLPPYPPPRPKNRTQIRENPRKFYPSSIFLASIFRINFLTPFFPTFSIFDRILAPILDAFWHHFSYFLHCFFWHRFCIDFLSTFLAFLYAQSHVFYYKTNSFEHFSRFQKSLKIG